MIKHWIDTWTANTTEAEFKTVLEALCHKMHDERLIDLFFPSTLNEAV